MTTTQPDPTTTEASIPVRCEDRPPDRARFVTAAGVTAATAELTAAIGGHTPRGSVTTVPPEIQRRPSPLDPKAARSLAGLADLPTIVAVGPFDDPEHAEQLAAAFTMVRRQCEAQLVLVGTGVHRGAAVRRAITHDRRDRDAPGRGLVRATLAGTTRRRRSRGAQHHFGRDETAGGAWLPAGRWSLPSIRRP